MKYQTKVPHIANYSGFCVPYICGSGWRGHGYATVIYVRHLNVRDNKIVWCFLGGLAGEPGIEYEKFCEIAFL